MKPSWPLPLLLLLLAVGRPAPALKDLRKVYRFREDLKRGQPLFNATLETEADVYVQEPPFEYEIRWIDKYKQFEFIFQDRFDYNTRPNYAVWIIAEERDSQKKQVKVVRIEVLKVNKYRPYFLWYDDTVELEEEEVHGIVLELQANDDDKKDYLQSRVVNEVNLDGKFAIKQEAYNIEGFPINNVSLINVEKLDYESITSYRIEIIVEDNQNSSGVLPGGVHSGRAIVHINVKDVDDQNPTFIRDCGVNRIKEHSVGIVATVRAIDGDRGIDNPINYNIIKTLESSYFGIRKTDLDGILFVIGDIDRESENIINNPILSVNISANEHYENGTAVKNRTTNTTCTIIIEDINDNLPIFDNDYYLASVKENTQFGIPITLDKDYLPYVSDKDEGENAKFEIFLENHDGIFQVTPTQGINNVTFIIRVNKTEKLDYERQDLPDPKQFNFKIVVKETVDENPGNSTASVTVLLEDVNDNFPEFLSLTEASVYENASKGDYVAEIKAVDIDSGDYGTKGIRYRLMPSHISSSFSIDEITGTITVATDQHGFDYEKIQDYYLTVEARDENGTGNGNTTQLHVSILDVNDNPPLFPYDSYTGHLVENAKDFADTFKLEATDKDQPDTCNSMIRYRIEEGPFHRLFEIGTESGVVTPAGPLDFEEDLPPVDDGCVNVCTKTYRLTVIAYDLGVPSLSSSTHLLVVLMDENDNAPIFNETACNYTANINETSPAGTYVAGVHATDRDKSPIFSNVSYTIVEGGGNNFVVERKTGKVDVAHNAYLNITDDRTKLRYQLTIEATDAAMKKNDDHFCRIFVNVTDVNDVPPKFINVANTGYQILENVPNKSIGLFEAVDPDQSKRLEYSILFEKSEALKPNMITQVDKDIYDYTKIFKIYDSGHVWVINPADREEMKTIDLTIKVVDIRGEINTPQEDEMRFRIVILDENDNDPVFVNNNTLKGYINKVSENRKDIMLFSILANDVDENNTITYSMKEEDSVTEYFELNSRSGELRLTKEVDYEETEWLNFTVSATDSGVPSRNAWAEVTIEILDENDNVPQFVGEPYVAEIKEHEPNGTFVIKINATDEDSGEKGLVHFAISDMHSDDFHFQVEKETGKVAVLKDLDREIKEEYRINIRAYDNPFNRLDQNLNHTQIIVTLIDINDNPPEITPADQCWRLPETAGVGEAFGTVTATDRDKEGTPNSQIEFFMLDTLGYFDITSNGTLLVNSSLEDLHQTFPVEIMARDKGRPPLNSTRLFCVEVYDTNTHKPEFVKPNPHHPPEKIYVDEDSEAVSTVDYKLYKVVAEDKDKDKTTNGKVTYEIVQDDQVGKEYTRTFTIDPEDGLITVNKKLKKAVRSFYQIIVQACDNGKPRLCAEEKAVIHVYVKNDADSRPKFKERQFYVNFTEHSKLGEEKFEIPEASLIEGNDSICYFIVGGDVDRFELDKSSRMLTIAEELDREKHPFHSIIVRAKTDCSDGKSGKIKEFDQERLDLINITVRVIDINDNAPVFIKANFTGGIKASDRKGKHILHLNATDADEGENAIVTYHVTSDIAIRKGENLEGIGSFFLLNRTTGQLTLDFQPTSEMKGHFRFTVTAKDKDDLNDTAQVLIYLMREDQQIKILFSKNVNEFTLEDRIKLQNILQEATRFIVNIDDVSPYSGDNARYSGFTEVLIHFVDPKPNEVIEANEAIRIIDRHYREISEKTETTVGAIHVHKRNEEKDVNKTFWEEQESYILIAAIGTLAFCMFLLLIVYYIRISSYKRLLKAATAKAYADTNDYEMTKSSATTVPNTNLHAMLGSNPIWNRDEAMKKYLEEAEELESDDGSGNSLDVNEVDDRRGRENGVFSMEEESGHKPWSEDPDTDDGRQRNGTGVATRVDDDGHLY